MRKHKPQPNEQDKFPMATVIYYGPDDKTATKVVVGVIMEPGKECVDLKRWVRRDVSTNPTVRKEIKEFLEGYPIKSVVIADRIMGCPHEEGLDFPMGGDCPLCPFWKGKQGSGAKKDRWDV
jgi:hypothetical protein